MAELTVPRIDFSSLGDLPAIWKKAQNEQKLADLGRGLADGTIDYKNAAAQTAGMGDITHTLQFLALAEARKKQEDELAASNQFRQGLQGMYGAQPGPGVPTPSAMPVPGARAEATGGSDAIPSVAPRAPVPSTSKVWGDAEAEAAGLYPPSKPASLASLPAAPAATPASAPAPAQAAPTATAPVAPQANARVLQLIDASGNPRLPQAQREAAKTLLTHELAQLKPNERAQFLREMQANPALLDIEMKLKAAGKTEVNIDQKSEGEFEKEFGKGQAKRWNGYIEEGQNAERKIVDINSMREISRRMGSLGAGANVKEAIGPYAEALGININGLSDIQAYNQIIQRLAPQQRAPGSGSTSDIEFKGFLKSLPTLSQNPDAREMGLNTMEALARDDMARGEIASRLATKEITRKDAERQLRALPDPMQGFVEWRKANSDLYGQALKGGGTTPATSAAPAAAPKDDGAARVVPSTKAEIDQSLANARARIARDPGSRNMVLQRLREAGLPTDGL